VLTYSQYPTLGGRVGFKEADLQDQKSDVLKRLAYIEGHLKGIRRMVESDEYCVDILKQTYAVKRAIDRLEGVLLSGHLDGCVRDGFHEGREDEMIGELSQLFDLSRR
jgi:DNA-binding FrmR family transcriptional regulator